jgi:hypothetical protein
VIYEQLTITGEREIIDPYTCQVTAIKCIFTTSRGCSLCGERFAAGDQVEATFPVTIDMEAGQVKGGPWEGFTSRWLRDHAMHIREMSRGKSLLSTSIHNSSG